MLTKEKVQMNTTLILNTTRNWMIFGRIIFGNDNWQIFMYLKKIVYKCYN